MEPKPTTEDRVWAVLAHLSALAMGMGILLPVVGWSEQRRKSKYASFQCLQALGYQSLGFTVWLLLYLLLFIVFLVFFALMISETGEESSMVNVSTGMLMFVTLGSFGIYLLLPIIAAISCALGKDFRYPLMGNRLAKYLGYADDSEWLNEEHEDRWVAAMGHFAVIIALWGLLAPITAWMLQGKRSLFLKFQSIQTTVYHALVNVLYIGTGGVVFAVAAAIIAMTSVQSGSGINSGADMAGIFAAGLFMLCGLMILLLIPLFHILGQWAGYRVLKGDNYRYPIIGRLAENRISRNSSEKETTS